MAEKSVWQLIFDHLKDDGFDVFSPGQHIGECLSKYVVLKDAGSSRYNTYSTDTYLYDVMCYVPASAFSSLEPFVAAVESSLKKMFPLIKPTGYHTPSFLDDTNKSYMVSLQYSNYRKVFYN